MPLPLTVSCFNKIQIGFTFLVPAHLGSPGQRAVKRVCVCVCVVTRLLTCSLLLRLHAAGLVFFLVLRRLIFQNPELRELSRWPFTSDSSVCDVWGTVYRSNNSVFSYCDITCVPAEPTAANPPKKEKINTGRDARYYDARVCWSVFPFVRVSQKRISKVHQMFCTCYVAWLSFSPVRYVLPVWRMTSCCLLLAMPQHVP